MDIENRTRSYMNGQLINESTAFNYWNLTMPTSGKLYIGGSGDNQGRGFKGRLDDFRIYDGALTTTEIAELYASELDGKEVDENTILVPAGSTETTVYLFAADDDVFDEGDELLNLEIDTVIRGKKGTSSSIQITVKDNDIKPTVSLNATNTNIKEGSNRYATVEAQLDEVTTADVIFTVSTSGDASDKDYVISIDNDTSQVVANLAAHYTFGGNADDVSGNENNGEVNGATLVADRFGNASSAMYFDGIDDVITVPYVDELRIQKDITVNTWIKVIKRDDQSSMRYLTGPTGGPWLMMAIHPRVDNNKFAWSGKSAGYWDDVQIECLYNNCTR